MASIPPPGAADTAVPVAFHDYRFDPHSGELRRSGVPVHLTAQSVAALRALLARPGVLVPREDLIEAVWGDRIVEYDQGLHNVMRQLRRVFEDDAQEPRFIETVPRQGYRFIAETHRPEPPSSEPLPADAAAASGEPSPERAPRLPAIRHRRGLKLLAATVALVLVTLALVVALRRDPAAPAPDAAVSAAAPVVVVLPLRAGGEAAGAVSEDTAADGELPALLQEGLIRELWSSSEGKLIVVGTTTVRRLLRQGVAGDAIAEQFEATHLVRGSVERHGSLLTLGVQLEDLDSGVLLWSDRYVRSLGALPDLEGQVADAVLDRLLPHRFAPTRKPGPLSDEAVDQYLSARRQMLDGRPVPDAAVAQLRSAARLEPRFLEARLDLARSLLEAGPSPAEVEEARRAVAEVLQQDPENGVALAMRGRISLVFDRDWQASSESLRLADRTGPGLPEVRLAWATFWSSLGEHERAVDQLQAAVRSDPLSSVKVGDLAFFYLRAGLAADVARESRRLLELAPEHPLASVLLFEALLTLDELPEARRVCLEMMRAAGASEAWLERATAAGDIEALRRVDSLWRLELWTAAPASAHRAVSLATLAARLGDPDEAIDRLHEAVERGSTYLVFIPHDPDFRDLRDDPRFVALVRDLGYPRNGWQPRGAVDGDGGTADPPAAKEADGAGEGAGLQAAKGPGRWQRPGLAVREESVPRDRLHLTTASTAEAMAAS